MLRKQLIAAKPMLVVIATLLLSSAALNAGEGRRPIYEPIVIGPGDEGKYIVTRNIVAPGHAIQILAGTGDVEIDLNGYSLRSPGVPVIQVSAVDTFRVHNGKLSGGDGVSISMTKIAVVEDLLILPGGENWGVITTDVSRIAIRRNMISGSDVGISVDTALGGTIEDNVLDGYNRMRLLDSQNIDILRNRIDLPPDSTAMAVDGCAGCRFADNLIGGNGNGHCMSLDRVTGSRISGNVTSGCVDGIVLQPLSHYNLIVDNTITLNSAVGLLVQGTGNFIDRNLLSANGSWGLHLEGIDNVYKSNVAKNNGGVAAACPGTGPATTDLCDATSGGNQSSLNQPPTLAGDNLMPDPR